MTHRALFIAIALLIPLTTATALVPTPVPASVSSQPTRCASKVGAVLGYDPTASASCSLQHPVVNQALYAGETVQTIGSGDLTFQSGRLQECIQLPAPQGTGDIVRPRAGIALKHLRGVTWCKHSRSDTKPRTLRTPGAVIRLHGTTFGIQSNGKNSTVKVTGGRLTAISTFSGRFVTITGGQQASFPAHGSPSPPRKLKPSALDFKAISLLSVAAVPMGIPEILQSLQSQGTQAVILVAIDNSTVNSVGPELTKESIRFHALLASQVQSTTLNSFSIKLKTQTVVVAAPAADARPVLDDVHDAAPKFSIIFYDTTP